MPHALNQIHNGPHLYGPGGMGRVEFDPAPLLTIYDIAETRDLPGFVDHDRENAVTYESHHFWIHFLKYKRSRDEDTLSEGVRARREAQRKHFAGVLIRVNHGGGWEVWEGDAMLAKALAAYGDNDRGAFLLCWSLIDCATLRFEAGRVAAKEDYVQAFVDGRLKKRKLPAQGKVKVWIEPPVAPSPVTTARAA